MRSIFLLRTSLLFLLRSGRSALTLALMLVSAIAALIFLASLANGVNDAMVRNSVGILSGHITVFNLPAGFDEAGLKHRDVRGVLRREHFRGILSVAQNMALVDLVAVDPVQEQRHTALWQKSVAGSYPRPGQNDIFISRLLAEQLGVRVGGQLMFRPALGAAAHELRVSGIYHTGIERIDRSLCFLPLGVLPQRAQAWDAAIFLAAGASEESVMAGLHIPPAASLKSWQELMPDLSELIELNYYSMLIVIILVFGVVSIGVGCIFVIFILKHIREYGIMKSMGLMPQEIAGLVYAEVLIMCSGAAGLGCLLGLLLVALFAGRGIDLGAYTAHNQYFVVSGVIYPRLSLFSFGLPPLLALISGLLSASWPAIMLMRYRTAAILRSS